ncbi:hypothetical protein P167DRAFT_538899 [Morchella conica CCBAS932]|uniref:Mediator of RNA polymerase II transcription subunit 22 n=1 Tax=Morchella conica CCBAS932 TaxID=1392247 RepID=A0A3N4KEH2_9PEZI|nr:hypothetical protein P167DRAFT_538899 [Morchella conica CCBAS932]
MSDPSLGVRSGLQGRVNHNLDILLKRFENISQLAPVEGKSREITAAETYQIECHASAMIRAAEDLLSLTRSLKEAWLFGQLGSELGVVDPATDENAKQVGKALQKLASKPRSSM